MSYEAMQKQAEERARVRKFYDPGAPENSKAGQGV